MIVFFSEALLSPLAQHRDYTEPGYKQSSGSTQTTQNPGTNIPLAQHRDYS